MDSIAAILRPDTVLQVFYLGSAITLLTATRVPALRDKFLDYGSRQDPGSRAPYPRHGRRAEGSLNLLDRLSVSLQVPHAWFWHFYAVSLAFCLFWAYQILLRGSVFQFIAAARTSSTEGSQPSMSKDQVMLIWLLMTTHSARRLYESTVITNSTSRASSKSTMWLGHYLLGISYYIATTTAIWIEGTPTLKSHRWTMHDFTCRPPSIRTILTLPVFILAAGMQHDFHAFLASLRKYTLPTAHPLWSLCICPHYFAECLMYAALAVLAAPAGQIFNKTLAAGFVFVVVNLSITAARAQRWYADKFTEDKEAILSKSKIFPGIY